MRVAERERREASATSFYFLVASKVRACSLERLPRMQDLTRDHPDWIVKKPIDMTSSLLGDYREDTVGVSHRWEQPDEPDTTGVQLATLKRYLADHPKIKYVWFDYSCMPQQPRLPEEDEEFSAMLSGINVIYLGMKVLILLDMSYMSRFWTQAEAWMSMQDASDLGLATASEAKRRYTIAPLHNAGASLSEMLTSMWAGKSTQEAHDILAMPDVLVTNQGDKIKQLPKIKLLNETIKQELGMHATRESALQALAHAVAAKDPGALTTALSAAEAAGLAPANLETGRNALAAAHAAHRVRQKVLDAFSEAQRVASEAFDRAQQLAKDTGTEVRLSSNGSTLTVTVLTESDGKLESLELKKACLEHMTRLGESEGDRNAAAKKKSAANAPKSSACMVM